MKFGQKIKNGAYPEWKYYYLDYDSAKRRLKEGKGEDGTFTEDDEANFIQKLEAELEKVAAFRKIKGDELARRLLHCETIVHKILTSSTDEDIQRFSAVEDEISRIIIEVNELSKFIRLNYSGFLKILKKHDKHMHFILKPMFNTRLASHPFYKESFDGLIIRLSKLFDIVRTGGLRETASPDTSGGQNFVRRTTKYWVHPDDVTEVKCIILKHLPVLVFSGKANQGPDPAITSIYYDNDNFELYQGRLDKSEGAEAIRIRWYGGMDQTEIFMERKTHREDWTGESSVKSRFSIKEKYVNDFCKGKYSMDKAIEKMKSRGQKSGQELEEIRALAHEVQETISSKKLHPVVRTFYNRGSFCSIMMKLGTAFQLPGDARVRISLDTELTMVREDNYDSPRAGASWRRMDIGIDYPFSQLPKDDLNIFPYAILEVKLQTQHGTEAPHWVDELIKSHLVEEVPKFSKFIHGVATLLDSRVHILPFWLPQMDKSIKKPAPSGYISQLSGKSDSPQRNSIENSLTDIYRRKSKQDLKRQQLRTENGTDVGIQIEDADLSMDKESSERVPLLDGSDEEYDSPSSSRKGHNSKRALLGRITELFSGNGSGIDTITSGRGTHGKSKQPVKRIALPVRVEPKVFFANERTFLSWLHCERNRFLTLNQVCIVLGGLALGLLNFGDRVGMISGLIFTLVSMLFMLYALFLYHWRAQKIRNRDAGPYDDRLGPTVLVFTLFLAVMINFYLKFTS